MGDRVDIDERSLVSSSEAYIVITLPGCQSQIMRIRLDFAQLRYRLHQSWLVPD